MHTLLIALLMAPLVQAAPSAPVGRAEAGKAAWAKTFCINCHGPNGEGGFGPDLAGRGLSFDQFETAVRTPWGRMLAYNERQLPDQELADLHAYLSSLPKVARPGTPRFATVPGAPWGQKLMVDIAGCAQCHMPELGTPRKTFGGEGSEFTFEKLAGYVYNHTEEFPAGKMGNYSRERLQEPVLREIYRFLKEDLGLRVPVTATLAPGASDTYTLTLGNSGIKGKGLTAENLTVSLVVPDGVKVVSTTGSGYKGLRTEGGKQVAVWEVSKLPAGEKQPYSITLSGPADFKGSAVRWTKPEIRRPANLLKQANIPDKGDAADVVVQAPKPVTSP